MINGTQIEMREAVDAHRRGDLATAERIYRKCLAASPGDFDALNMLGVLCAQLRRLPEAEDLLRQALAARPDSPEARNNFGNLMLQLGKPQEAVASFQMAIAKRPQEAEFHVNLGNALLALKQLAPAAERYEAALRLRPDHSLARRRLAEVLLEIDRLPEALEHIAALEAVLRDDPQFMHVKGRALQEQGALEEAKGLFAAALDRNPGFPAAWLDLALLAGLTEAQLTRLEALAAAPQLAASERALLEFAQGKAHDDLGRHEEAFAHLTAGNRLKRSLVAYDEAKRADRQQRLLQAFTPSLLENRAGQGCDSELPIFILGFPRSGTTLVEQILSRHPAVHTGGERTYIGEIASGLAMPGNPQLRFPECLAQIPARQLRRSGEAYVGRLQALAPGSPHITDKSTVNFLFAGFIHLILPKARMLHVRRDARDTCFSCYATYFRGDLDFSYDLGELGREYRQYFELMDFWRGLLPPGRILDIDYETLVEDLEGQSRRMLDHCGLAWDARCLDFHRSERVVRTASLAQVRKPIYRSSLGRWRHYEKHLGPLFEALVSDRGNS
jgi:tetratricopeptide (TPR) repeat protein